MNVGMKLSHRLKPVASLSLALCLTLTLAAAERPMLGGVKRVVFLGDSITYAGQYVEFVEAWFVTRFPERRIEFLDIGLPSETVSGLSEEGHANGKFPRPDLHERLDRVLTKTKPDLVIACYGMNCGIYLPFDEGRFAKYRDGLERLRKSCAAAGAKVLHVTPPTFDEMKGGHPGYGATLDRYSDWLLGQRMQGWNVVDLHGPMNRYLAEQCAKDPNFFLASDGVHCNETGHWIIARQILLHLGAKDVANATDAKAMFVAHPSGEAILKLVQQRQRMMKDAWLTETRHLRPGMKQGLPLAEVQSKADEFENQIRALVAVSPDAKVK
jgi:lysophospholipase L1-like esterase